VLYISHDDFKNNNSPRFVPRNVIPYIDKVQVWVRKPVDQTTLAALRKECGKGGLGVNCGGARFNALFRQRLEFRQPSRRALEWIANRDDALINRIEIALDFIHRSWADQFDAEEYLNRYKVRRWHLNQEVVRSHDNTTYDGPPEAPNKMVCYKEDFSRITGELYCVHFEWRATGVDAVRSAGIRSGKDLLNFDHRAFWERRLLLRTIQVSNLGRWYRCKFRSAVYR
jgi:hypothetical protein